jgi:hypothetical protein
MFISCKSKRESEGPILTRVDFLNLLSTGMVRREKTMNAAFLLAFHAAMSFRKRKNFQKKKGNDIPVYTFPYMGITQQIPSQ